VGSGVGGAIFFKTLFLPIGAISIALDGKPKAGQEESSLKSLKLPSKLFVPKGTILLSKKWVLWAVGTGGRVGLMSSWRRGGSQSPAREERENSEINA